MPWQKNESADFKVFYEPVAHQLAIGRGLYLPSGKPALKYPPGIPVVYAATFWFSDELGWRREQGLRVLQASVTLATSVLITMLAVELLGTRGGLLTCLLWSTYPFHLWTSKQPSGEALACIFLLLAVWAFVMWSGRGRIPLWWGSACGAMAGGAALTKPFHIALAGAFVILAWICDSPVTRWKRALFSISVLAAFAVTILPWELWASRQAGHLLLLCNNDAASVLDGLTFGAGRIRVQDLPSLPRPAAEVAKAFAGRRREFSSLTQVASYMVVQLREKPAGVALLFAAKAIRCWYANDSHRHERWTIMIQLLYLPLLILGACMAWRKDRPSRNFFLIGLVVTFYYWGMTTVAALAIVRYMLPATSLLMVFASQALCLTAEAFGRRATFVKKDMPAESLT
jgi:4-amino-4-deoxy-L-arabinose transferase-like glycosyltransferase